MAALVLAGCSLPRDPEGTLQRATGGTIRAGVTAREPWARLEGEAPAGVEVDLVEGFAREIDAEVAGCPAPRRSSWPPWRRDSWTSSAAVWRARTPGLGR